MATAVLVYKCNRCGCIYPADYFEAWGTKYGSGLGREPVCEALTSNYASGFHPNHKHPERSMFPVANCRGSMSQVQMTETESKPIEYNVPARGDEQMAIRAPLMQLIQADKRPELRAHLKNVVEAYKKTGRPVPSHLATI